MRRILFSMVALSVAASAGTLYWAKEYFDGLMNYDLYRGERYYGDSKDAEYEEFLDTTKDVLKAQTRQLVDGHSLRVFHAKQHGCLTGTLNILNDRPGDPERRTFNGIFDPAHSGKQSYQVLVRFSNGLGVIQHDKEPDVRGIALKLLGVYNHDTKQEQSVDFTMTNSPIPAGRDLREFAAFMSDVSRLGPTAGTSFFAATHYRAGRGLLRTTGILGYNVLSLAGLQFWGGHAYLLGPDQAMKLNLRPEEFGAQTEDQVKQWGDNYLRRDLAKRLKRPGVPLKYLLQVQLEKDPHSTPIEDNLTEWTEAASKSIPVAELVFDEQSIDPSLTPAKEALCNSVTFTPGHYVPEHRPLSNMGRGRIFAYKASQLGRFAHQEDVTLDQYNKAREEGRQALSRDEN